MLVNLCGCIRIPEWLILHPSFSGLVANHYVDHPVCRQMAEQDRVWQARKVLSIKEVK